MKVFLSDPFQVRKLEKQLKRKLTEQERAGEMAVRTIGPDGKTKFEWVQRHNMRDFYSK